MDQKCFAPDFRLCYHCCMLPTFTALLKTMRPKQWAKNGFVFAALIFDRQLTQLEPFALTLAGFLLFCLLSSVVYIINDLSDLEADRQHPEKRFRPLASGELAPPVAVSAAVVLIIFILPLAFLLSPMFGIFALVYLVVNLAYSRWFKHIPIIDVLVLSGLYVVRVAAGVSLITVTVFSPWLYVFTIFLALFLGVGKRRAELNLLVGNDYSHRPVLAGYTPELLDQMITIVTTMTIMTYSFYTFSAENLPLNHTMMLTIPFVMYGIFRYLYLVQVRHSGGAPEEVLFTDRPLQVTLFGWMAAVLLIFYVFYN
jgi:4-hydroxybenzoate polyprenyltransferase